jgi:ATP-dependent HslUV protease ATP-binding subunit HslU
MVFYMPGSSEDAPLKPSRPSPRAGDLTPHEVVAELDRYIVGQRDAKRAVAIALRNRWRRRRLPEALAEEVLPKNILMIGPTGVGKTEIARRLARLTGSPFLKIEATKYTEVGYVGRDCESMIRDLVELAIEMVKAERRREVQAAAAHAVEERIVDALLERAQETPSADPRARAEERERLAQRVREGELDDEVVTIDVPDDSSAAFKIAGAPGMDQIDVKLGEMLPGFMGRKTKQRQVEVREARRILQGLEEEARLDEEAVTAEAIRRTEQDGMIFLDELDKVAVGERGGGSGPDVSRQGVQRDLLPIVEGTIVQTKHGGVRTDHILFVAAGAFHVAKPSDLIPELQGRFPIRVELSSLDRDDLLRILTEPEGSLIRQYAALLSVDGVSLEITDDAIAEIAALADQANAEMEDIGARRLATVLERLLEPLLFDAPQERSGTVAIDAEQVRDSLSGVVKRHDLARYVL